MRNSVRPLGRARTVRGLVLALAVSVALAGIASSAQADCPNEQVRQQQGSTALPDCRAYERVSPSEKNAGDIDSGPGMSSLSGEQVMYASLIPFGETEAGALQNTYIAQRTGEGWQTRSVSPPQAPEYDGFITGSLFDGFSAADLSSGLFVSDDLKTPNERHDLGLENTVSRTREVIESSTAYADIGGYSKDLSHVVFEAGAPPLTPEAPSEVSNVYDWSAGQLHLINILPDGKPAPEGGVIGSGTLNFFGSTSHAVSDDGSRIYFTAEGQLYVRVDDAETRAVSAPQESTDPAGTQPASFQTASVDGDVAFFTSTQKLTPESTADAASASADLYRYDLAGGGLTDLSLDSADASGAQVQGVVGASESGERVYFVANAQLVPGQGTADAPNLYLWTAGAPLSYLTTLSTEDEALWNKHSRFFAPDPDEQVSSDGTRLLFSTQTKLTDYENNGYREVYLFDAQGGLKCISCNPAGTPATGGAGFRGQSFITNQTGPRGNLTADGRRAFFVSPEALVPGDANGQLDVYEWEEGALHLISTGQDNSESELLAASPDGSNVFITTRQRLSAGDIDNNADVYDAREKGGFLEVRPSACTGTGCQGAPPAPPIFATPASSTFSGVGNFAAAGTPAKTTTKAKTKTTKKVKRKKTKAKKTKKAKAKKTKAKKSKQAKAGEKTKGTKADARAEVKGNRRSARRGR